MAPHLLVLACPLLGTFLKVCSGRAPMAKPPITTLGRSTRSYPPREVLFDCFHRSAISTRYGVRVQHSEFRSVMRARPPLPSPPSVFAIPAHLIELLPAMDSGCFHEKANAACTTVGGILLPRKVGFISLRGGAPPQPRNPSSRPPSQIHQISDPIRQMRPASARVPPIEWEFTGLFSSMAFSAFGELFLLRNQRMSMVRPLAIVENRGEGGRLNPPLFKLAPGVVGS